MGQDATKRGSRPDGRARCGAGQISAGRVDKGPTNEEALYKEMALNYYLLNRVVDLCHGEDKLTNDEQRQERERAIGFLNSVSIAAYEYYTANEKGVFLSLDDAPAIRKVYERMGIAASDRSAQWVDRYRSVYDVFAFVKCCQKEGTLDIPRLMKYRAAHRERTIDRIERYNATIEPNDTDDKPADVSALILDSKYAPRKP